MIGFPVNPMWRLLPWALVALMGTGLWGAYGYVTAAREARAEAEAKMHLAVASKEAAEKKAVKDQALLADRDVQLAAAHKKVRERDKRIMEYKPNENCLTFDTPLLDLDRMLPNGAALQASPGS